MQTRHVMTDHPSWIIRDDGSAGRAVRCGSGTWHLSYRPDADGVTLTTTLVDGVSDGRSPRWDVIEPTALTGADEVVVPLREAGTVARLRNPDLWDAAATSIVRQVIRATQARKLYRGFAAEHGQRVDTPGGPLWLFPTPDTVLSLPDAEFARLGMAFKRQPLRALAEAFLEFGDKWSELHAENLLDELQSVKRIGPWTARATVADFTNDYRHYPYGDLAVRTWAGRLAPFIQWPQEESEFARTWASMAGDQLSDWTLLTLAWGIRHANGAAI